MIRILPRDKWPPSVRHFAYFLIGLAIVSVIISATFWWGGLLGSFVAIPMVPVMGIWALAIIISGLVEGWRQRESLRSTITAAVFPILGVCLSPLLFIGIVRGVTGVFTWATLALNYESYNRVIDLAAKGSLPPPGKTAFQTAADGTKFQAERRPPHRVAFLLPGGFLNSWQGILYDPSGIGRRSNAMQPDGKPGDLLDDWWTVESCSRMVGHFYSCSFS